MKRYHAILEHDTQNKSWNVILFYCGRTKDHFLVKSEEIARKYVSDWYLKNQPSGISG